MRTSVIKWDESMAARCLAKYQDSIAPAAGHHVSGKHKAAYTPVPVTAPAEKPVSVDIAAGEWDGFEYALNNALKKKNK